MPEGCMVLGVSYLGFIPWDNPDNIISQQTEKVVDAVVGGICLPVLFLISFPCNILNMLVFWTQGIKERVNLCLFYLSCIDFLHMLNNFLFNFERIRVPFALSTKFGPVFEFIVDHYLIGFIRGFGWLSGFVSMMIASERCLCVVSPLRAQTFMKTKTTAVLLVMATVVILTGSLLIGLRWSLVCAFDPETNITSTVVYTSKLYAQHKAYLDVVSFLIGTVLLFFNVTVVSAATIVTSVKLKKMVEWREQSSTTLSSREVALTRMLIAVSIVYIICAVPTIIVAVGVMFVPGVSLSGRYYNFSKLMIHLLQLTSLINASFNFFVYILLGSRFKETLRKLLCCVS